MSDPPVDSGGIPEPDENRPSSYPPTDSEEKPQPPPIPNTGGAGQALTWLLGRTPFLDLHRNAGDSAHHKVRGFVCFSLDVIVRLVVVVLLLSIIAAVAYKTLTPLPDWRWF